MDCSDGPPVVGWRLFRVRRAAAVPCSPLRSSTTPTSKSSCRGRSWQRATSRTIPHPHPHPRPAAGCRCGLYAAIEGTLDSLAGYLLDSAHDHDPPMYAEVPLAGRAGRRSLAAARRLAFGLRDRASVTWRVRRGTFPAEWEWESGERGGAGRPPDRVRPTPQPLGSSVAEEAVLCGARSDVHTQGAAARTVGMDEPRHQRAGCPRLRASVSAPAEGCLGDGGTRQVS